jgi:hypothetical protein
MRAKRSGCVITLDRLRAWPQARLREPPKETGLLHHRCDDGEANCKPVNKRYTRFDDFLAREIPKIEASPPSAATGSSS